MADNSLGSFDFITLTSSAPDGAPLVMQNEIATVQRPGVDGTAFIKTGLKGKPFQMRSFVDVDTFANAVTGANLYQSVARDEAYVLVWCGINYSTTFNTRYFVIDVSPPKVRRCNSAVGGLVSNPQAVIEAIWTLVPVHYVAP